MNEKREILNKIYSPLHTKATEILIAFRYNSFDAETGWYNGHFVKDESGEYQMDFFPIPVISVKDCCDIEAGLEQISVTAKLRRGDALSCSFEDIKIPFEAYGVEDYLSDYYHSDMTKEQLHENIKACKEKEIGFCFIFDQDTDADRLLDFARLLKRKGFYY